MASLQPKGSLIVVSGPSGAGKSSICRVLLEEDERLHFSISCTTRSPRPGEADGVDYYFLDRAEFEARLAAGAFIEHAEVHGNLYGTLSREVQRYVETGRDVLLDIDVQGARQIRRVAADQIWSDTVCFLFIGPPSLAELERRLRGRGTEEEAVVQRRLGQAWQEMAQWSLYDYMIINDDLTRAVDDARQVLRVERLRTARWGGHHPWPDPPHEQAPR